VWLSSPETHTIFRDDGPPASLGVAVFCDNRVPVVRIECLDGQEPAVSDILESPKAVLAPRKHPLQIGYELHLQGEMGVR